MRREDDACDGSIHCMSDAEPRVPGTEVAESSTEATLSTVTLAQASAPPKPNRHDQFEAEFTHVQHAGVFYALMLLPVLVAIGWRHHTGSEAIEISFWAECAMYTAIAVCAVIWRRDWLHLLRLPQGGANRWVVLVLAVPLGTIAAALLVRYWAAEVGFQVQDLAEHFTGKHYPVWAAAVSIIVLAPVFEEIAFRGVLLGKLQRVMSPTQAIWVTATLFGVIHFSVLSMAFFIIPLALAAAYVTCRTKSLLPAICMHAAHNAGVVFFSLLGN